MIRLIVTSPWNGPLAFFLGFGSSLLALGPPEIWFMPAAIISPKSACRIFSWGISGVIAALLGLYLVSVAGGYERTMTGYLADTGRLSAIGYLDSDIETLGPAAPLVAGWTETPLFIHSFRAASDRGGLVTLALLIFSLTLRFSALWGLGIHIGRRIKRSRSSLGLGLIIWIAALILWAVP